MKIAIAVTLATYRGARSRARSSPLTGEGETFGVSFRPVMFQALLGASMASITDRVVPLERVLGKSARLWARALDAARSPEEKVALTEAVITPLVTTPSPHLECIRDLVERIAVDRAILRVEDIARAADLEIRTLQRCFRMYVGISPKSVIQRYRPTRGGHPILRAASNFARHARGIPSYADQAHFGRDCQRTVGQTPREFGLNCGSSASKRGRRLRSD